jgi:cytoskeletal protein RodZ
MTDDEKDQRDKLKEEVREELKQEEDEKKSFFKKYIIIFGVATAILLVPFLMFYFLIIPNAKTKNNRVVPRTHISQDKTEKKQQEVVKKNKPTKSTKVSEINPKKTVSKKSTAGFWRGLRKILKIFSFK